MRLVLPAWRRGFFRGLGSLADWAVRLKIPMALWWQPNAGKTEGESITVEELRQRWPMLSIQTHPPMWVENDEGYFDGDCVIGLPGGPPEARVLVDHGWDMLNASHDARLRCYATELQRRTHGGEGIVTGMPSLDAVQKRDAEPAGAWAIYGPKWQVGTKWSRAWWRRLAAWPSFFRALRIIREEAEQAGVSVILQTRPKDRTPAGVRQRFATNPARQLYPHPGLALLHAVDLVIHWQSGVVFEAAAVGVPQLSLPVSHDYLHGYPASKEFYRAEIDSAFRWSGVVEHRTMKQLRVFLRRPPVLIPYELNRYRMRFCGPLDGESGRRVLEAARR